MKVKVINISKHALPEYKTALSAGMDLTANIDAPIELKPLERRLIPTGLSIELPAGYEAQVRPRSGMALKYGLTCLNSPGTIDAGYRGEIKVVLLNTDTTEPFQIRTGERIAQLIVMSVAKAQFVPVDRLPGSDRGEGGFGSTGGSAALEAEASS